MYQTEPLSDKPGVFKNFTDTGGFRRCCNIKILRCFPDKQVTDSAADNISFIARIIQPADDSDSLAVYLTGIDGMLCCRIYKRF